MAGEKVRVQGRCVGYLRTGMMGGQPITRSDWQLEGGDGSRIWVTGPFPAGCTGSTPAPAAAVYSMLILEDTLPAMGDLPARPRRYLKYAGQ